ncbi:MAG: hypothetical protein ACYC5O_11655 [Anaerolineae bacterium]
MGRWRRVIAAGLLVLVVALGLTVGRPVARLAMDEGHVLVEAAIGETPERRVAGYMAAIRRGDRDGALALWVVAENAADDLKRRRDVVTDELLALGSTVEYTILDVEWWRNCCEPGPAGSPAGAGVARMHLVVSRGGSDIARYYTLDVTTPTAYWGAAGGDPVRRWLLRDVYRQDEQPIAFPWPLAAATPPPLQTLADAEHDQSAWLTYTSADWPISFRYPPGWGVMEAVYARPDYGPVIRITAGERVLELVRRGRLPRFEPGGEAETGSVGPVAAWCHVDDDGFGPRRLLLVPARGSDVIAYVSIVVRDTEEDEEYLEVFQAVLDSIVFGQTAAQR